MTPATQCDKVLLVQAELDGELDAAAAASLAAHRAGCPICQTAAAELAQARALFAAAPEGALYHAAPDELGQRIAAQIAAATHSGVGPDREWRAAGAGPGWWRRWRSATAGFGLGAVCAAALALLVLLPRGSDLAGQVVAGHIRALQPGHLIDLKSTKEHTVRPWFDGKLDFAPPVKDLADQGFPLDGCRLDYVDGHPAAALVYTAGRHAIDVFVWPSPDAIDSTPGREVRNGYNVYHLNRDKMAIWVVSDLETGKLHDFVELWREAP